MIKVQSQIGGSAPSNLAGRRSMLTETGNASNPIGRLVERPRPDARFCPVNRKERIQDPHENWLTIGDGRCHVAGRHHRGVGTSVVRQHGRRTAKCCFEAAE
jgi:hypothetical protein